MLWLQFGESSGDINGTSETDERWGGPDDRYFNSTTYQCDLSTLRGDFNFEPWGGYGQCGHIQLLPINRVEAAQRLAELRQNMWIDRGTRVVAVNFNLYNTNSKLVSVVRIVVEFYNTGFVRRSHRIFSFRLIMYSGQSFMDMFRLIAEVIYGIMLLYYMSREIHELVRMGRSSASWVDYFYSFRNNYEMVIFGLNFALCLQWYNFLRNTSKKTFDVNEVTYQDLWPVRKGLT